MNKLFCFFLFIFILALARLIPHPPNFTPIIASAIISPIIISNRVYAVLIPILAMFISDLLIGFHPYMFVVYLTISIISLTIPKKEKLSRLLIFAFLSSCWFFLVTNFAVWLAWDYYTKDLKGLITCYTLAIPFFTNTLISSVLFTGIFFYLLEPLRLVNQKFNQSINYLFQKNY